MPLGRTLVDLVIYDRQDLLAIIDCKRTAGKEVVLNI